MLLSDLLLIRRPASCLSCVFSCNDLLHKKRAGAYCTCMIWYITCRIILNHHLKLLISSFRYDMDRFGVVFRASPVSIFYPKWELEGFVWNGGTTSSLLSVLLSSLL